ncbi:hypothetical protein, partial [Hymenobacter coccineus]|uniref:hypothetical protein n=1 Tax=Hymenobacter coccineus TaxID=1908235 RepID=UPI003F6923B1
PGDAGRLGAAIVRHYFQSVEDEPQRQLKTTLVALGDLATGGDAEGRALRPTLYDLLAQRAIAGLQNQELYLTRPEQQFQVTDPKLFGSAQEFAALKLGAPATDSLNGPLLALRLLQRLTAARLPLPPPTPGPWPTWTCSASTTCAPSPKIPTWPTSTPPPWSAPPRPTKPCLSAPSSWPGRPKPPATAPQWPPWP